MNTSLVLSVQYDIPTCLFSTQYKSVEETVVDFILYTRRKNYIVTLNEISRYVYFNVDKVTELLYKHPQYIEPNYCELINRLIYLNLNFKQQCITKALYKTYQDYSCPFVLLTACICFTYEILEREYCLENVVNIIKEKFPLLDLHNVKIKLKEIKQNKKQIECNNTYALLKINQYFL